MLQSIRNKSKTIVVQFILALIALSFVFFGVEGFNAAGNRADIAATVGDRTIPTYIVQNGIRQQENQVRQFLGDMVDSPLYQEQLRNQVINQMVERALLLEAAENLNLSVDKQLLQQALLEQEAFQTNGEFDRNKLRAVLAANGISESLLLRELAESVQLKVLISSLQNSVPAVPALAKSLARRQQEKRQLLLVKVPLPKVSTPSDADLQVYYDDNQDTFRPGPLVTVSYAYLDPKAVAKNIEPSEEEIKARFDRDAESLSIPEKRDVSLLLAPDEATAKELLASDKSLKELADENDAYSVTRTDGITKEALGQGDVLTDVVFAAPVEKKAGPVETPFGWQIVEVHKIITGKVASYEDQQGAIKERLALEAAYQQLATAVEEVVDSTDLLTNIDDNIAGQEIVTISEVSVDNLDKQALFKDQPALLVAVQEALQRNQAFPSPVQRLELGDNSLAVLQVAAKKPATVPAMTDVRDRVLQAYINQQQQELGQQQLADLKAKVEKGESLGDTASVEKTELLDQAALASKAPALVTALSGLGEGQVTGTLQPGNADAGIVIAKVLQLQRPAVDALKDTTIIEQRQQVQQSIATDVLAALTQQYRQEFSVKINKNALTQ